MWWQKPSYDCRSHPIRPPRFVVRVHGRTEHTGLGRATRKPRKNYVTLKRVTSASLFHTARWIFRRARRKGRVAVAAVCTAPRTSEKTQGYTGKKKKTKKVQDLRGVVAWHGHDARAHVRVRQSGVVGRVTNKSRAFTGAIALRSSRFAYALTYVRVSRAVIRKREIAARTMRPCVVWDPIVSPSGFPTA